MHEIDNIVFLAFIFHRSYGSQIVKFMLNEGLPDKYAEFSYCLIENKLIQVKDATWEAILFQDALGRNIIWKIVLSRDTKLLQEMHNKME